MLNFEELINIINSNGKREPNEELLNDVYEKLETKVNELCGELLVLEGIETGDISPNELIYLELAQRKLAEVITLWLQSRMEEGE